ESHSQPTFLQISPMLAASADRKNVRRRPAELIVAPRSVSTPDRCCSIPRHVIRKFCNSILRLAYAWTFHAFALRLVRCDAHRARTDMAPTQSRKNDPTDRVLVPHLFRVRDRRGFLVGRDLGSRQFYDASGGRSGPWQCLPRAG